MVTWVVFGPIIIVSTTALLIAASVYSWQKGRDRELFLRTERRIIYKEFFASAEILLAQAGKGDFEDFQRFLTDTRCIYNNFIFSAPVEVISACRLAILGIEVFDYNCRKEGMKEPIQQGIEAQMAATEAKRTMQIALKIARADLLGSNSASSEYAVNLVYGRGMKNGFGG